MIDIKINNLIKISAEYNNICIHFNSTYDLISKNFKILKFVPCTKGDLLKMGFMGYIDNCRMFAWKQIIPDNISSSNYDGPIINSSEIAWSHQIKIIDLNERYIKLKAFW